MAVLPTYRVKKRFKQACECLNEIADEHSDREQRDNRICIR